MGRELLQREQAITFVKDTFSTYLKQALHLIPISSPLIVLDGTGINDDLNGIERPVSFPIKSLNEQRAVVVHSLAKWKRVRLKELSGARRRHYYRYACFTSRRRLLPYPLHICRPMGLGKSN